MKSVILFRVLFLLLASVLGAAVVRAEDLSAIRARMEKRIPAIDALKERRIVGENNRGFLEARANPSGPELDVISTENADRREVYAAIAAKEKTTIDSVGRQRAEVIEEKTKRGVWVQKPEGDWYQKG